MSDGSKAMKEYTITPPDGMETTVLLSDEDAKARGITGGKAVKPADMQVDPANKSVTPSSKKATGGSKA